MIGKRIGGSLYAHRDYIIEAVKEWHPEWLLRLRKAMLLTDGFPYTIIKVGPQNVSFIVCKGFNTAREPTVGKVLLVNETGTWFINPPTDPWIYHGKEDMVGPDYKGFDRIKAIMWHRRWKQHLKDNHISHTNIGKKSVWERIVGEIK